MVSRKIHTAVKQANVTEKRNLDLLINEIQVEDGEDLNIEISFIEVVATRSEKGRPVIGSHSYAQKIKIIA